VAFSHSYAFCTWVVGVGWRLGLTIFLVAKSFRAQETSSRPAKQRSKLQLQFLVFCCNKFKYTVERQRLKQAFSKSTDVAFY